MVEESEREKCQNFLSTFASTVGSTIDNFRLSIEWKLSQIKYIHPYPVPFSIRCYSKHNIKYDIPHYHATKKNDTEQTSA